jgi:hypothetical protein
MLTDGVEFDAAQMEDRKLARKSEGMRSAEWAAREALAKAGENREVTVDEKKDEGVKKNCKEKCTNGWRCQKKEKKSWLKGNLDVDFL